MEYVELSTFNEPGIWQCMYLHLKLSIKYYFLNQRKDLNILIPKFTCGFINVKIIIGEYWNLSWNSRIKTDMCSSHMLTLISSMSSGG